jgi:hypothetical protein
MKCCSIYGGGEYVGAPKVSLHVRRPVRCSNLKDRVVHVTTFITEHTTSNPKSRRRISQMDCEMFRSSQSQDRPSMGICAPGFLSMTVLLHSTPRTDELSFVANSMRSAPLLRHDTTRESGALASGGFLARGLYRSTPSATTTRTGNSHEVLHPASGPSQSRTEVHGHR